MVKPLEFVTKGRKGLAQPAANVRGREYLRIIYGPEYTLPENLERLKGRGLGTKRSLALRENSLWDWKHLSDSCTRNLSGEFTSASSAYLRSRVEPRL